MKPILLVLLCFNLFHCDVSANSNLQISIQSSRVANLYYQVLNKNQPIIDELEFRLIDHEGNEQIIQTKQSILSLENIPFGNYELKLKNSSFSIFISIDKNYLKTQHILKKLELSESIESPNTNDHYNVYFYIFLSSIILLMILLIVLKKS